MPKPTRSTERKPEPPRNSTIIRSIEDRAGDIGRLLVDLAIVEATPAPAEESRAYWLSLHYARFRADLGLKAGDVGPAMVAVHAMHSLPRGAPVHAGFIPAVLRALVQGCRCAPEAFQRAGVLPAGLSKEGLEVAVALLRLDAAGSKRQADLEVERFRAVGSRRLDTWLAWWATACAGAMAGGEYRRLMKVVLPVTSRSNLLAAGRVAKRRLGGSASPPQDAQETVRTFLAEVFIKLGKGEPTWMRVEKDGGLGLDPSAVRDLLRTRHKVQTINGVEGALEVQAGREADPSEAVGTLDDAQAVRAVRAVLAARAVRTADPALRAVREHLEPLLTGSVSVSEVARQTWNVGRGRLASWDRRVRRAWEQESPMARRALSEAM